MSRKALSHAELGPRIYASSAYRLAERDRTIGCVPTTAVASLGELAPIVRRVCTRREVCPASWAPR